MNIFAHIEHPLLPVSGAIFLPNNATAFFVLSGVGDAVRFWDCGVKFGRRDGDKKGTLPHNIVIDNAKFLFFLCSLGLNVYLCENSFRWSDLLEIGHRGLFFPQVEA